MQLTPGNHVGPYRIDGLIARGGMGAVYRATRNDGALVALKVLGGGRRPEQVLRFEREAELTARLSHPGIVRVHGAGSVPGLQFIAMDLIAGEPLSERCGRLTPLDAARLVAQVARGIEHAHARGILHRDIKPSNVLVRHDDDQALITDFGIARALEDESALTRTGALIGTPLYMSPEQAASQPATTATDVHGLGILLYEAITGKPPFEQSDLGAVLLALTRSVPPPPSSLRPGTPRALDRLCLAALEKEPSRRPTAGAFAAGLEQVVAGTAPPHPRVPALGLLAGVAAVMTLAAVAAMTLRTVEPPAAPPVAEVKPPPPPPPPPPTSTTTTSADPPWLRSLRTGDLEALRGADEALRGDALLALEPTIRARAVRELTTLDADWKDPRPPGQVVAPPEGRAALREALERLVLTHALRRRLEPGHRLPPGRRTTLDEFILQGALAHARAGPLVRALVELAPDDLDAHVLYAQTGIARDLDEDTLRRGLELAETTRDEAAWPQIAGPLSQVLHARVLESSQDPRQVLPARQAFDALLEQVLAREREQPALAARVLHLEATIALRDHRYEAALSALDRALPLSPAPWDIRQARLGARLVALRATGAEPHREGALGDLDALLELATSAADPDAQTRLALGAIEIMDFFTREGWTEPALTVLDRALGVLDPAKGAECSFSRVVLIARAPQLGEDRLASALEDLVTRATARRLDLQARKASRDVLQAVDALISAARDASARLARGTIAREEVARSLEGLDGRLYLRISYVP